MKVVVERERRETEAEVDPEGGMDVRKETGEEERVSCKQSGIAEKIYPSVVLAPKVTDMVMQALM
jgi:hypothetical protein